MRLDIDGSNGEILAVTTSDEVIQFYSHELSEFLKGGMLVDDAEMYALKNTREYVSDNDGDVNIIDPNMMDSARIGR